MSDADRTGDIGRREGLDLNNEAAACLRQGKAKEALPLLQRALELLPDDPNVLLNLGAVEYIDSAGLGEMSSAYITVSRLGGKLRLLNPQAKVHVLIVPKKHAKDIRDISPEELAHVQAAIQQVVRDLGLEENGFRVVTNAGPWAGQSVEHVHFHLLGGQPMGWPPFPKE